MNEKVMSKYIKAANDIAETTGYDPLILTTHAFHESGGFEKIIGRNNFWGLKVPTRSEWTGLAATIMTHEYENIVDGESYAQALARIKKKYGAPVAKIEKSITYNKWKVFLPQKFRDWQTTSEAVKFYINFIKQNYPAAFEARADYQNYFKRLVEGKLKYATDPAYARKNEDLYIMLKNI
jgi:flagellum-specific peptidoglycan hydrolase FlgJ